MPTIIAGRKNAKSLYTDSLGGLCCCDGLISPFIALDSSTTLTSERTDCKVVLYGRTLPEIKKVIFNEPATIILWNDGEKTVVRTQNGEPYDKEKGFVMAYMKRMLGNDNTFNKEIHKWVEE